MTNQEAIEVLTTKLNIAYFTDEDNEALGLAIKALEERPQGEWYYNNQNGWHCSICNESVKDMPTAMGIATFNFCPNCGAKMKDNTKQ